MTGLAAREAGAITIVNEKTYPWIADIPDEWGVAGKDVIRELDTVLSIPTVLGGHVVGIQVDICHTGQYRPRVQ